MMHLDQKLQPDRTFVWKVSSRLGDAGEFQMALQFPEATSAGAKGMVLTPISQGSFASTNALLRERFLELWSFERRANLWRESLLSRNASTDVDAISETVDSVLDSVGMFGPESIDLQTPDLNFANAEHLVAILRSTFTWRSRIPGWARALNAAPQLLTDVGLEPALILKGLDE